MPRPMSSYPEPSVPSVLTLEGVGRDLPADTVTFLFTDIEGSTALLERYPQAYPQALQRHDALLRSAVSDHRGYVFETIGDAFYAAFARASDAVASALQAQRCLATAEWDDVGVLRARMALHTGEVERRGNHYFGVALYRCARLQAIGHGGQTLLSGVTAELVRGNLAAGAALRDLGEHGLKDFAQPEHVWQLLHAELPSDFPPLRSPSARRDNLPIQLTSFVGRARESEDVQRLLATSHLVTLTGPGGVGKTRLALRVGGQALAFHADGVWLTELASSANPELIPRLVGTAVGIREDPGHQLVDTLIDRLRSRNVLLILDNCEHLLQACGELCMALLGTCQHLRILTTSREPLGITGEIAWSIPPLESPETTLLPSRERVINYPAVQLFMERALAVRPDFSVTEQTASAVAEVCRRLDGIPLAIELAAARVRILGVEQIARRLDDRLRFLTGGHHTAPTRQQTLVAALDWSYELLTEPEQQVLRRLAVFAGGWDLESAETVTAGDGIEPAMVLNLLGRLVDKSLVVAEPTSAGSMRYLLLETVRQYAYNRLATYGEADRLHALHAAYFLALAAQAEATLWGPDIALWQPKLETEHDNLRAALQWFITCGEVAEAQQLGGVLARFWHMGAHFSEGRRWLAQILALQGGQHLTSRARVLIGVGLIAAYQADYTAAATFLQEGVVLSRATEDHLVLAYGLFSLGLMAWLRGDQVQARSFSQDGLEVSQAGGYRLQEALNLFVLSAVAVDFGDHSTARSMADASLAICTDTGFGRGISLALSILGRLSYEQGNYARAAGLFDQALAGFRVAQFPLGAAWTLALAGRVSIAQGNVLEARGLLTEGLALAQELGLTARIPWLIEGLGEVAAAEAQFDRAIRLAGAASVQRASIPAPASPTEQMQLEQWLAPTRAVAGAAAALAAWSAGRSLPLEQAIAYALQDEPPASVLDAGVLIVPRRGDAEP
jgi:predicted ATPase/class 3 adenylate cyclase